MKPRTTFPAFSQAQRKQIRFRLFHLPGRVQTLLAMARFRPRLQRGFHQLSQIVFADEIHMIWNFDSATSDLKRPATSLTSTLRAALVLDRCVKSTVNTRNETRKTEDLMTLLREGDLFQHKKTICGTMKVKERMRRMRRLE